jgi:uncharacterized membrane protein
MLARVTGVVAVICVGLYAGIIFGDRLGASFSREALDVGSFITFQQIQHVHFKPVLMPLTLIAVLASVLWVVLVRSHWRQVGFWVIAAGTLCMVCAFLITRIVNFPINDELMTWSAAAPPGDVRTVWTHWEHAHTWRAIASVCAFVLQTVGLGLQRGP